jgi:23S rRNA (cytidine1920-2'-O)/16S rRNA (cytidine1409-2'-O)-methyltransferase
LDVALVERGLEVSRERAQRLIVAGEVTVDGEVARAPSTLIAPDSHIAVGKALPYVGRGGVKLAHALDRFGIAVAGRVCLDAGASTGGFTDCLLQRGAARVYAVDVGRGQLAWRLRHDPRVVVMEGVNVRYLRPRREAEGQGSGVGTGGAGRGDARATSGRRSQADAAIAASARRRGAGGGAVVPEAVSLATVDVAFISLRLVLPAIAGVLAPDGEVVALVKPQFEAGPADVGKGGVVRNPAVHRRVLHEALAAARAAGLAPAGLTASPIRGQAGNVEFLLWARPLSAAGGDADGPRSATAGFDDAAAVEAALGDAQNG